jgi:uncharacterized protein (DUF1330 family)
MAAYAIFLREETSNPLELETYATKVGEIRSFLDTFSPEVLAAYGAQEVVEGDNVEGVVLVKFPTYELATQWYHSPEYQNAAQHRLKAARYRGIIFDGLDNQSSVK